MTGANFKLQEVRLKKGWTLRVASQKMAVSMTVLFNAEQGVLPRVDHAIQIAKIYGQSVEELWSPPISAAVCTKEKSSASSIANGFNSSSRIIGAGTAREGQWASDEALMRLEWGD